MVLTHDNMLGLCAVLIFYVIHLAHLTDCDRVEVILFLFLVILDVL